MIEGTESKRPLLLSGSHTRPRSAALDTLCGGSYSGEAEESCEKQITHTHIQCIYIYKIYKTVCQVNTHEHRLATTPTEGQEGFAVCQSSWPLSRRPCEPKIPEIKIESVQFYSNHTSQRWKLSSWLTERCDMASFWGLTGVYCRAFTSKSPQKWVSRWAGLMKHGGASLNTQTVDRTENMAVSLQGCLLVLCLLHALSVCVCVCVSGGLLFGAFASALETNC